MRCKFCFATFQDVKKTLLPKGHLPKEQAIEVVRHLAAHGFDKITFAGGEPTLCPWLTDLIRTAKEAGMTTMIVTNGTGLKEAFLLANKDHLDWIAISIDSLKEATNVAIGRAISGRTPFTAEAYLALIDRVKAHGYRLKLNTVVNRFNWKEDLSQHIRHAKPERWKVLQALPIIGQNDSQIDDLVVSEAQFEAFLQRHDSLAEITRIVPETNAQVRGSYVMVDPAGRFFDDAEGVHRYSKPILEVGTRIAIQQVCYDAKKFEQRGGIYDWGGSTLGQVDLSNELAERGWAHLKGTDQDGFEKLASGLGDVIHRTEVRVKPEGRGMVTSPNALDLHTDHHAARFIAWYCHRQSVVGGESLLLDASTAIDRLSAEHQKRLCAIHLHEHKVFDSDPGSWPLMIREGDRLRFYYSFWLVADTDREDPAFLAFREAVNQSPTHMLKLQPGDVLVVDNHRVLHGRRAIGDEGERYLERVWIA